MYIRLIFANGNIEPGIQINVVLALDFLARVF